MTSMNSFNLKRPLRNAPALGCAFVGGDLQDSKRLGLFGEMGNAGTSLLDSAVAATNADFAAADYESRTQILSASQSFGWLIHPAALPVSPGDRPS